MNGKLLKTVLATVIGSVLLTGCGSSSSDTKPASVVVNPISTPSNAKENGQPQANKENESTSETTTSTGSSENAAISTIALPETSNQPASKPATEPTEVVPESNPLVTLLSLPSSFIDLGSSVAEVEKSKEKEGPKKTADRVLHNGKKVSELPDITGYDVYDSWTLRDGKILVVYYNPITKTYRQETLPSWYKKGENNDPGSVGGVDTTTVIGYSLPDNEADKTAASQKILEKIIKDIKTNEPSGKTDNTYVFGYGVMSSNSNGKLEVKVNGKTIKVGDSAEVNLVDESIAGKSSGAKEGDPQDNRKKVLTDPYSFAQDPQYSKFLVSFGDDSGSYIGGDDKVLYAFGDKSATNPNSNLNYRGTAVVKLKDKYHVGEFAGMINSSSNTFTGMIKGNGLEEISLQNGTITNTTYTGTVSCTSCGNTATFEGQLNGTANQGTTGVITDTSNKISGVFGGSKVETAAK